MFKRNSVVYGETTVFAEPYCIRGFLLHMRNLLYKRRPIILQEPYRMKGTLLHEKSPNIEEDCVFVCWLLNAPAICECISGTDLLRQFYVLPH